MSFLYNHHTKKPQIWTYPIFVILAAGMFYMIYAYGESKARDRMKAQQNAVPERSY